MAIIAADIKFQLSGGAANADPNAALGGAISNTEIVGASLHNLFDIVGSDEAAAGDSEYRCFYIKNTHATLTMQNTKVFVQTETPNAESDELLGLGTSVVNGVEQAIADESTAPAGVVFTQSTGVGNALVIGDIPPGEWKAVWYRRDISVGASAINNDTSLIRVTCDTAA